MTEYRRSEAKSVRTVFVARESAGVLQTLLREPLRRSGTTNAKPEIKICVNRPIQAFFRVIEN